MSKEPPTAMSRRRWVGLVVSLVAVVVILPLIQADEQVAQELTARQLIRGQIGEIAEAVAEERPAGAELRVRFHYEGIEGLEDAVWEEASRHGELVRTDGAATRVTVEVEAARTDRLRLTVRAEHPLWPEPVVTQGEQRVGDWASLLPPLVAILAAIFLRKILIAMAAGVWLGAIVSAGYSPLSGSGKAARIVGENLLDPFHLHIIGFTFALVGMVHVIIRMGGMAGVLEVVSKMARTARSTRIATALMGFLVFFDDYANTIVVGSTMRPLTDAKRISREKLAYIVDSTAAPVAGIAIISTWIGYEVGLFEDLAQQLNLEMSGYEIFLGIIPFRFYCLFALALVLWNVVLSRDFGSMLKAERRAATTGAVLRPGSVPLTRASFLKAGPQEGIPHRWYNAVIPIVVVIAAVLVGVFWSGEGATGEVFQWQAWQAAFSDADSAMVLFWASVVGSLVAMGLALTQRLLSPTQAIRSWLQTVPSMWLAVGVLLLAWSIRTVCDDLGTSVYLVGTLEGLLTLTLIPLVTFLIAALVAFATGTSWGAMGILLPTMIPVAAQLGDGTPHSMVILMLCFAAVLDGAIYGDHCSPISDTTILSSVAAGSDHVDHVRTQAPYATLAMVVAASLGYLGVAMGLSPWLALPVGIIALGVVLRVVGRRHD